MAQPTNQLRIDGLPTSVTEDKLKVLLQNKRRYGGGPVENIRFTDIATDTCSAIITFKENEAVDIILGRGNILYIDQKEVEIKPVLKYETKQQSAAKDKKVTDDSPEESTIKAKVMDVHKTKDSYILYFEDPNISQGQFDEDSVMLDGLNKTLYVTFKTREAALATCRFKHSHESNFSKVEMATDADFDIYSNIISIHGFCADSKLKRNTLADYVTGQTNLDVLDVIQEDEPRSAILAFDQDKCDDVCSVLWQCASTFNDIYLITAPVFRCFTVSVKGLNPSTTDAVLHRYLSNKRSGGGEVKSVARVNEREARVTFKEQDSYDGVLEKSEHKLEDSILTIVPYYPCLSKNVYEKCISYHQNIPMRGGKPRPYQQRPALLHNSSLKYCRKTFYLSAAIETFHNKFQACFEIVKFGNAYLRKHPEILDTPVKQASCIWKIFNKKGQGCFSIQLDRQEKLKASEVKEILGRVLDDVRACLDTITVLEFNLDSNHFPGFQHMCHSTLMHRDFEVYFEITDNTVVFISNLSPLQIQNIMNDMYHSFLTKSVGATPNQSQFRGNVIQGQQNWNIGGKAGNDRGGNRGRFRRGSGWQASRTSFQGHRHFPVHTRTDGHSRCAAQQKPRLSISDETGVGLSKDDGHTQGKEMKEKNARGEDKGEKAKEGKKYGIVRDMELQRCDLTLLQKTKYHKDIEKEYTQLSIVLDFKKSKVLFKGNDTDDVENARFKLHKKISVDFKSIKIQDFSKEQVELLSKEEVQKKANDQIRNKSFHAHLQCSNGTITLFYVEPIEMTKVIELIKSQVHVHKESITSEMILIYKADRGCKFLEELNHSDECLYSKHEDKFLLIIAAADQLPALQKKIAQFTEENKPSTEEIPCNSKQQAFISRFQKHLLDDLNKSLTPSGTIVNQEPGKFVIKGPKDAIKQAQEKLSELCSQICEASMKLRFFGIKEYLMEKDGKSMLTKVENSQSCILLPHTTSSTKPPNIRIREDMFTEKVNSVSKMYSTPPPALYAPKSRSFTEDKFQLAVRVRKCCISFIQGDITTVSSTDAIVNIIDPSFRLASNLAQALVAKGGSSIQDELNSIRARSSKVMQTSAGLMDNCKKIIHMVCPVYGTVGTEIHDFEQGMALVLGLCETDGHKAIGMSPNVIGRLFQFPRQETCQVLMKIILNHVQDGSSNLSRIDFYDMNAEILKELHKQCENMVADCKISASGHPGQMPVTATRKKIKYGNVSLTVKQGDITDEICDAIVSSISSDLDLSSCGAVSKALKEKCGTALQSECWQKKTEMDQTGVVMTTAPYLRCGNIFHASIHKFSDDWTKGYERIFEEAERLKFISLAIPPFGAGESGANILGAEKNISRALQKFAASAPKTLLDIRLVVFTQETFEKLLAQIKTKTDTTQRTKPKPQVPPKPLARPTLISSVSEEVAVTVYTSNSQNFQKAKKELEKECKTAFKQEKHEDKRLKNLDKKQIRELEETGLKKRIRVTVKLEEDVVSMEGFGMENIYRVVAKINQLLVAAVEEYHRGLHLASKSAIQWQSFEGHTWCDFEPLLNIKVERDYQMKLGNCMIKDENEVDHYVDFQKMIKSTGSGGMAVSIRRRDFTADGEPLPEKWDHMHSSENVKLVTVVQHSPEFSNVEERFQHRFKNTHSSMRIKKIERVQNKALYQQYKVKKREMDQRNPRGHENEMRLYHGTDDNTVKAITSNGFSRNYSGKNATVYGEGVYFAVHSSYSHGYTQVDRHGNRMMFQSRVLIGESTPSHSGMKFLPNKPGTNTPFDSGSANGIFIIFHDAQAYPEYIITYQ